jgi:hypothetical protein
MYMNQSGLCTLNSFLGKHEESAHVSFMRPLQRQTENTPYKAWNRITGKTDILGGEPQMKYKLQSLNIIKIITLKKEETCHDQYGQIWMSYNAVLAGPKDYKPAGFCICSVWRMKKMIAKLYK